MRAANRGLSKPSGGNGKISRAESHALDVEFPKQGNQQLALKNNREQMALEQARGALIEKETAIMQAGYLLSSFRQRVLQGTGVLGAAAGPRRIR